MREDDWKELLMKNESEDVIYALCLKLQKELEPLGYSFIDDIKVLKYLKERLK